MVTKPPFYEGTVIATSRFSLLLIVYSRVVSRNVFGGGGGNKKQFKNAPEICLCSFLLLYYKSDKHLGGGVQITKPQSGYGLGL